ncbi:response regulator transcription factor [Paenibacillus glufosinatiresistens]|uniref:response regulator transcription factor n=1 Tax=Paenibacillus glufosinatiresistens TaxID=3070657 RepID=UPI00286DFE6C|nr:response regulator transcription factor [Paenibacillus sp. YX.27]
MNKILFIENEKNTEQLIGKDLLHEAYAVTLTHDECTGLQLAKEEQWDLILLDFMPPGFTGIELCRQIRATKQTPIIILTAETSLEDKIDSLDSGADDYLPKPVHTQELLARMRSLLRRAGTLNDEDLLVYHDLELDIKGRMLKIKDRSINLTKREFEILFVLMKNAGRVMMREMLLESVWGYDSDVDIKIVDVYISYLRSKIDEPGKPSVIKTMRGLGYVIRK